MLIRRARKDSTPVVILAGFLGAGKTTILNHILRTAVGARIAVIVNDFGSVNIDSLLISAQTDRKLELTNGCVCCSMDGGELEEVLETALATKPDVVIVEASGIAEPEDLARMVILSPNPDVGYGGLVYVVDAVNYEQTLQKHRRISEHIELADLVVVAKTEKVPETATLALRSELSGKTKVPVVLVKNGELAPELLFDVPSRLAVQPSLLQQGEARRHLHSEYAALTFETAKPIAPEKFKKFMGQLPEGVYRMKGIVYFGVAGYEQKFVLQSVSDRWDMYAKEWGEKEVPHTQLVVIGLGLQKENVLTQLEGTVGESTHMLDIRRYQTL